jgi:hypothetical protein
VEDQIIKLELKVAQINAILGALAKLPFEQSSELIFTIQKIAQEQLDTNKKSE